MDNLKENIKPCQHLEAMLHSHSSAPFLFIGSGFSQRYLGLPTWSNLLEKFSTLGTPFSSYIARADSVLPQCASLMAKDYADQWLTNPSFSQLREEYGDHIRGSSSALKIAIAKSLRSEYHLLREGQLVEELDALRSLNAEGIITTNWDNLLERLFPEYKVFIGQQSIIRDTPQGIAEIFKIHGCCSDPNSLVLTAEDYDLFQKKQAYLAAKLITIFVEHPVVFIGYSMTDANVLDLLSAVLGGLGPDEIVKLQNNLIFVQRAKPDRPEGITKNVLYVDRVPLTVTAVVANEFTSIYTSLAESKLKLPVRILRFCAEQLYEVISSKEPSKKLALVDIDEIHNKDDVEFVVGLGVAESQFSDRGYQGLSVSDIFGSVIRGDPQLDARRVLEQALPDHNHGNNYLPVFKFLKEAGIKPSESNSVVQRLVTIGRQGYKSTSYARMAEREIKGKDFNWVITNLPADKAALFIPHMADDKIPLDQLRDFAISHFDAAFSGTYSSTYRKLFCLYDYLKYRQYNEYDEVSS